MKQMQRIGILTSGGDAPGMNAAVRAAVRAAVYHGVTPFGIYRGYQGIIDRTGRVLGPRDVSDTIQRGGTVLLTARCEAFFHEEGRQEAAKALREWEIDGLVLVGGDGTFTGAIKLAEIWDGAMIGVPGTIDNDLYGTDLTIGFDTAVNTALDCIDKVRDTAEAHERLFFIEVMGRHAGFIALATAIAGGAENVLIPEEPTDLAEIAANLVADRKRGKKTGIIVVAEGGAAGEARTVAAKIKEMCGLDAHVTVLGHVQRGGRPSAVDRVLATRLGAFAVEALMQGETGKMAGEQGGEAVLVPFTEAIGRKKEPNAYLRKLIRILAT